MVGPELAAKLLAFARAGGTLVFEAGLGLREENTWMKLDAPGGELAALGFRLKRHFRLHDGEVALELDLLEGRELRVAGNLDRLEVAGEGAARAAGRFRTKHFSVDEESPAALEVPIGEGRAISLAFSPGMNADRPGMTELARALAEFAGVRSEVALRGAGVEGVVVRTLRAADGRRITFLRTAGGEEARLETGSRPEFSRDIWGGARAEADLLVVPPGEFAVLL
jgi:hypothetical protein